MFETKSSLEDTKNQFNSVTFENNFSSKIENNSKDNKNIEESESQNIFSTDHSTENKGTVTNLNGKNLLEPSLSQMSVNTSSSHNMLDITTLHGSERKSDQSTEVEVEVEVDVLMGQDTLNNKQIYNKNCVEMEMKVVTIKTNISKCEKKEQIMNLHDYLKLFPNNEVESLKVLLNCKNNYLDAANFLKKLSADGKLLLSESFLVLDDKQRSKFQNSILRRGTNWAAVKVRFIYLFIYCILFF